MGLHIKYLWTPEPWKMKVLSPKNMGLQPLKIKVVGSQGSPGLLVSSEFDNSGSV